MLSRFLKKNEEAIWGSKQKGNQHSNTGIDTPYYTNMCMCIYVFIRIHAYTYIDEYIYIYYIYIYVYT
jgi:hypothetical protein